MSVWLAILLLVTTINPPRRRSELGTDLRVILAGAAVTLTALVLLGAVAESLLDALDITVPTFRVAVGLVLIVRGIIDLFVRPPGPGGELPGLKAAIAPVFFPVLFRPEIGLLAISVAVDGGLGAMTLGAALGLALVVALVARGPASAYQRPLGLVFSTGMIILAVDRLIDGVFAL